MGKGSLTVAFLVLLGAAWLAVILPAVLRARHTTAMSTAERWRRRMALIAPRHAERERSGRWVVIPEARPDLARASFVRGQRRRKRMLEVMVGACLGSLGTALLLHGAWQVQLACDASVVLYSLMLIEAKRRRRERAQKVRSIARRRPQPRTAPPELALLDAGRVAGGRR